MNLVTRANNKPNSKWFISLYHSSKEDFKTTINNTDSIKIILIHSGQGIIKINDSSLSIFSSSLIILNNTDKIEVENNSSLEASSIYFHPMVINSKITFKNLEDRSGNLSQTEIQDIALLQRVMNNNNLFQIGPRTLLNINNIFLNISSQLKEQADGFWPCRARSYLIELIILLQRIFDNKYSIDSNLTNLKSDYANDILIYLYNNLNNKVTITDISKNLGLNKNLIQKYVLESTGMSTMSYLNAIRIELSCLFLRDTTIPINEISERCGFFDITNFGRTFKKHTTLTPTEYRNGFSAIFF